MDPIAHEALDRRDELLRLDGLGHMHLIAGEHRSGAVLRAGKRSESDGRSVTAFGRKPLSDVTDELIAIAFWHADVTDDYVQVMGRENSQPFFG